MLSGVIRSFECGDNCYLILGTQDDDEVVALCVAPQCIPWNEQVTIPDELIGASVTVNVGAALQFDGSGNVMGAFPAFTDIQIN